MIEALKILFLPGQRPTFLNRFLLNDRNRNPHQRNISGNQNPLDGIFKPISDDSPSYLSDGIFKPIFGDISSSPPNGICNPILDTTYTVQHHLRRVQISGHSSVQSSSTFESRKAKLANLTLQAKEIGRAHV